MQDLRLSALACIIRSGFRSELEVLNRYLRNYRELSGLLGQYAALAKEDAGYIQDAAEKLIDTDRNLLQ